MAKESNRLTAVYNVAVLVLLMVTAGYVIASFHLKGGIGNISGNAVADEAYQKGVQDTQVLITQEIINQLNDQGYVEVRIPTENGEVTTIRLGIIQGE